MVLTGMNFIGSRLSGEGNKTFYAVNPSNRNQLTPEYFEATNDEIDSAINLAENAFIEFRSMSGKERAILLDTIADEILELGDILIDRCSEETGLPHARLVGERGRTVNQLKMFANLIREGSWVNARIDTAIPDRQPTPKPDLRCMEKALGPVGIFGASNFPLAFSVAGGDTASALAAGCSVVVKAHPAHPGTCELVAKAIISAVKKSNMPDGVFSMLHGVSNDVGMAIVKHPLIKAIGFTGSYKGGKAIYDEAVKRGEPIPVYAEMGSTNPIFILPDALRMRKKEIAEGLTSSVTLGVGQFCTNPGLVFYENSTDASEFQKIASNNFDNSVPGTMLTEKILETYEKKVHATLEQGGISQLTSAEKEESKATARLLAANAKTYLGNDHLEEEIFGPATLAVTTENKKELLVIAKKLKGHLTVTIHATEKDLQDNREFISILERKVGRLIINGFPTGVEVCNSMVHGGPFPATTDSRSTSVGTLAIARFTRPISYQNFPEEFLPDELKSDNPLNIWRLVNGNWNNDK